MPKTKAEIVTFKVDTALLASMKGIHNRSEFIRTAILAALDGACPLCKGAGTLTPNQQDHWQDFAQRHAVEECAECHDLRLTCLVE